MNTVNSYMYVIHVCIYSIGIYAHIVHICMFVVYAYALPSLGSNLNVHIETV